jgi:hypothetical protein
VCCISLLKVYLCWRAQMLQPAENIHLIGVDPLDPTRSTYVATGDSGQVPVLVSSRRQSRDMWCARSLLWRLWPGACAGQQQAAELGHVVCRVSVCLRSRLTPALMYAESCPLLDMGLGACRLPRWRRQQRMC